MKTTAKTPPHESHWRGSEHTAAMVAAQIAQRWGDEEVEKYDPETNCLTFNTWKARGYHVKKGEKGLLSTTIVSVGDDAGDGGKPRTYPKRVYLFYYLQVEKDEEQAS